VIAIIQVRGRLYFVRLDSDGEVCSVEHHTRAWRKSIYRSIAP
jgi:hypothetical protein